MAGQVRQGLQWDARSEQAFKRALQRGFDLHGRDVEVRLQRIGLHIQNEARLLCPVDTGRLRSSIKASGVNRGPRGPYVEIGTNVEYAPYVEFGTRRMDAQPYMRPAFLSALGRWGK